MAKSVFDLLCGIKILSQNVRSFNCSSKRFKPAKAKILSMLDENPDILLLSECKVSNLRAKNSIDRCLKLAQNGPYISLFNSTSTSRGTAIVIKQSLLDNVGIHYKCPNKNALIVRANKGAYSINIVCFYLSNNPSDFSKTFNNLPDADLTIFGGDFNTVLSSERTISNNLDLTGRSSFPNPLVHNIINTTLINHNFRDFYRQRNPNKRGYSFKDKTGESRLDYICGNASLIPYIKEVYLKKLNNSFDHKPAF